MCGLSVLCRSRWAAGLEGRCSGECGEAGECLHSSSEDLPSVLQACHVLSLAAGLRVSNGSLRRVEEGLLDVDPLFAE